MDDAEVQVLIDALNWFDEAEAFDRESSEIDALGYTRSDFLFGGNW